MHKLTVIVVNYNSAEILECLKTVYSTVETNFETIVVDNNSSDDSVEKIKKEFPKVKIIENKENKGYGPACNQAIKIAQGKHILILNPDIILEQNTVEKLLKYLEQNKETKIVSCKLKNQDGTTQDSFREFPTILSLLKRQLQTKFRTKNALAEDITSPIKVDWILGALMLMRDKYYFDERYFLYFEDVDLCKTIGNVYYYPLVSATHLVKRESAKSLKIVLQHTKSTTKYFTKWQAQNIILPLLIFLTAFFFIHFFTENVPLFFEAHQFHEGLLSQPASYWFKETIKIGSSNPGQSYGDLVGVYVNLLFQTFSHNFYWWRVVKSIFFATMIVVFYHISDYFFLKEKKLSILATLTVASSYPLFLHTFIFDEPFMFAEPFKLIAIYLFVTDFYSPHTSIIRQLMTAIASFIAIKIYHPAYSLLGIVTITALTQIKKIRKYALLILFILLTNIPRQLTTQKFTSSAYGPKLWTLRFFEDNILQTITTPIINFSNLYYKSFPQIITFFGLWILIISVFLIMFNKLFAKELPKLFQQIQLQQNYLFPCIWILCELPIWFVLPETATRYASALMPPVIILTFMLAQRAISTFKKQYQKKIMFFIIIMTVLIILTNVAYTTAFRVGWGSSFVGQGNVVDYLENARNNTEAIALYQSMQVAPDFIALNKTCPNKYSTKTDVDYLMITNLTKQLTTLSKINKTIFIIKRTTSIKKQEYPAINLTQFKNLEKIKIIEGKTKNAFDFLWTQLFHFVEPNTFEIYRLKQSK